MTKYERKACKHLISRSHNSYLIMNLIHELTKDWKQRHPRLSKLGLPYIFIGVE